MPLQHLTTDQARNVADLAEKVRLSLQGEPEVVSGEDAWSKMMEYRDNPDVQALQKAVAALSDDARRELGALMWLGRGDFDDFEDALRHAGQNPPEANYISDKVNKLAEYLTVGLTRL